MCHAFYIDVSVNGSSSLLLNRNLLYNQTAGIEMHAARCSLTDLPKEGAIVAVFRVFRAAVLVGHKPWTPG